MLKQSPNFTGPLLAVAGLRLATLITGCAYGSAAPMSGLFDGTWVSPLLGYDVQLQEPFGVAMQTRITAVQNGDPVFSMVSSEGKRFTARQWLSDGTWHTVTDELKQDGKLYCSDGAKKWVMERRQDMN